MIDPLHQFMIKPFYSMSLLGWDVSFTNSALLMMLASVSIILFMHASTRQVAMGHVPSRLQMACEMLYEFVTEMIESNSGKAGLVYFPYIFSLFMFVLFGNLLGMVPYSFTFTSHIIVTLTMAFFVVMAVTIIGFAKHGLKFFRLFFPEGTPLFVAPLLVPVEIMSYLSRVVSLSVRLFANMVAGHAMLKIFAGFVVILAGSSFMPLAILPFVVNIAITGFEFLIAVLQAYVFTVLTCIYLNDALNLH